MLINTRGENALNVPLKAGTLNVNVFFMFSLKFFLLPINLLKLQSSNLVNYKIPGQCFKRRKVVRCLSSPLS